MKFREALIKGRDLGKTRQRLFAPDSLKQAVKTGFTPDQNDLLIFEEKNSSLEYTFVVQWLSDGEIRELW